MTSSQVIPASDGAHLGLATGLGITPRGWVESPVFFRGFLNRPDVAASGLLAVADVATTRYADVGLAKQLANLDPVVTASGDRLRFESFSVCNGVHARLDLLPGALGSAEVGFGTTNVDVNQPLRTALARVSRNEALHFSVGLEGLKASSPAQTYVEPKVPLPDRWVRGFAEVPAKLRGLRRVATLPGPAATRLLGSIPRVTPPGPTLYLVPLGAGVQVSKRHDAGAVPLAGSARIRACDRIARFAQELTLYSGDDGTTAWVFTLPDARLTLVLSPDPYRGFSGEGTLLELLADPAAEVVARQLLRQLAWSPYVDPVALEAETGLTETAVDAGLAWLAASGRLGFELGARTYFHRELPVDGDAVLRRSPRLLAAQRLVDSNGVSAAESAWHVRGTKQERYLVSDQLRPRCSCPWEAEHAAGRGPCKHVLAVLLQRQRS